MRVLPITNYAYSNNINRNNLVSARPSFGAYLDKDIFEKVKQEKLCNKYLTSDNDGDLPMHLAGLEEVQEIHRVLESRPDVIVQIHKTPNNDGNLPMHLADADEMQEIHRVLPSDVIEEIHKTPNNDGHLPMHFADEVAMKEIHRVLPSDVIAEIHKTPNNDGNLPMHLAMSKTEVQEILRALKDQQEVIAEILLTPNGYYKLPGSCWGFDEREEILQTIYNIATNSDVDLETSIKLLESYNPNSEYDDAIETLKRQLENSK